VVGAGPAGLFAARTLAENGVHATLFNRDLKPGGLAEYGIYPDKEKMKDGLRKQFSRVLGTEGIQYFGNVSVGAQGDFSLDDLRGMGFDAILITVGAQGTKWLGLEGEDLRGVYHAKDIVYHYNLLPPFSEMSFPLGRRVALIGAGNVMLDIAHWAVRAVQVEEVTAVVRRGPDDVKFTPKEFEYIAANLDLAAYKAEYARCFPTMQAAGQDGSKAQAHILAPIEKAHPPVSGTRFRFDFLASPTRMLGENGRVTALEVEETTLFLKNGVTQSGTTGVTRALPVDSVVFCIGDRVDAALGLPLDDRGNYAKRPDPAFPIEGKSYEAWHPAGHPLRGIFLAGWAREASTGLVGDARKDGTNGAQAVLAYLRTLTPIATPNGHVAAIHKSVHSLPHPVITTRDWERLDALEKGIAAERGQPAFKFGTNAEMLAALGLDKSPIPA
jgi:ferredoxin--NADP+ reductase